MTRFRVVGETLIAAPDPKNTPDAIYIGPDSFVLVHAAFRLAPRGERAADLGTGTGLLATLLARRYRTVVATDFVPRVAEAAALTLAANRRPTGHAAAAVVCDVAAGLRPRSFDLVTANAPWVPAPPTEGHPPRSFADGGPTGTELPVRFLHGAAGLLRAGGVAIVLALDVTLAGGGQPLAEACAELDDQGLTTALVATPINWAYPKLGELMRARQPALVGVTHVAAVLARPFAAGERRESLLVAVDALASRWAAPPEKSHEPPGPQQPDPEAAV